MTKVTILGQEPNKAKELKPIEFIKYINIDESFSDATTKPSRWKNIELVCRYTMFDIMFAYDDDRDRGTLYLGHFNDGVVE